MSDKSKGQDRENYTVQEPPPEKPVVKASLTIKVLSEFHYHK